MILLGYTAGASPGEDPYSDQTVRLYSLCQPMEPLTILDPSEPEEVEQQVCRIE